MKKLPEIQGVKRLLTLERRTLKSYRLLIPAAVSCSRLSCDNSAARMLSITVKSTLLIRGLFASLVLVKIYICCSLFWLRSASKSSICTF